MAIDTPLQLNGDALALESCAQEAGSFLEAAERELDGLEDPALWNLVHACKWLHAALEVVVRQQKENP